MELQIPTAEPVMVERQEHTKKRTTFKLRHNLFYGRLLCFSLVVQTLLLCAETHYTSPLPNP